MGTSSSSCCSQCRCKKETDDNELLCSDRNKENNPNSNNIQQITSKNQLNKDGDNEDENCLEIINQERIIKDNYGAKGILKDNIAMMKDSSDCNIFNKRDQDSVNNKSKSTNPISPLLQPTSLLEQSTSQQLNFGMSQSELTFGQQKLLLETQKNLNQFFQPQPAEIKVIQSKLAKIPLTSIVPEYKLLSHLPENEVLFNGELRKLINYEIKSHKPQMYSSRYCTLSRTVFSYYKSMEAYLIMNRPLCQVPLNQITKMFFIKTKESSKKIDHILICNKLGILKDKKEIAKSKLFEPYEQTALENNESLLIFTSEIEEGLYKWFLILNFLLNK